MDWRAICGSLGSTIAETHKNVIDGFNCNPWLVKFHNNQEVALQ